MQEKLVHKNIFCAKTTRFVSAFPMKNWEVSMKIHLKKIESKSAKESPPPIVK